MHGLQIHNQHQVPPLLLCTQYSCGYTHTRNSFHKNLWRLYCAEQQGYYASNINSILGASKKIMLPTYLKIKGYLLVINPVIK